MLTRSAYWCSCMAAVVSWGLLNQNWSLTLSCNSLTLEFSFLILIQECHTSKPTLRWIGQSASHFPHPPLGSSKTTVLNLYLFIAKIQNQHVQNVLFRSLATFLVLTSPPPPLISHWQVLASTCHPVCLAPTCMSSVQREVMCFGGNVMG